MSDLRDKRELYARDAIHESKGGDKRIALRIAEKNYQQFIGRELSGGEIQDLYDWINKIEKDNIEAYAEKYRKLTEG